MVAIRLGPCSLLYIVIFLGVAFVVTLNAQRGCLLYVLLVNVNKIWRFESVKRQNFAYDSPRRNIDHIERV